MHLEERGFGVDSAATGAEGFRMAEKSPPSAIVLDMRLPDASGIDLIPELKKRASEAPVLMITAHHDMATTILAMKAGAFDYIHKPIDIQAFDVALDRALEVRRLSKGSDYLSVETHRAFKLDDIVGASAPMQQLFKDVGRVAASRATVLIHGESGTGKELIARSSTATPPRKPFIGINCSAIVDTLLESELFGHEKAPSPARSGKPGKFELAEDGSIFLDRSASSRRTCRPELLACSGRRWSGWAGSEDPHQGAHLAATNRDLADGCHRALSRGLLPASQGRDAGCPCASGSTTSRWRQAPDAEGEPAPAQDFAPGAAEVIDKLRSGPGPATCGSSRTLTRGGALAGEMLLEDHLVDEAPSRAAIALPPRRAIRCRPGRGRAKHIVRVWGIARGHKGKTCRMLGISRPTLERKLKKYGISGGSD